MFARNARPQVPTRIGKYTVEQTLGEGGFGQVFRAYDASVGRSVAIKVLKAGADPSDFTRFRNEASAAGNLHHKNLVTIHEFGEQDGLAYLVMEFIEGQDLQKYILDRSSTSMLSKMQIMSQVAEGLYCAHQHGVVHRDVKPANIMVQPDGIVKIMDFGIARLLHVDHATLTKAGFLVGSVPYMSPEQFREEPIDALCDIWAYGIIYYELLSGTHPFAAPDATTIMYKITATEPVPILDVAPDCPRELADVIMRALSKDRDLRYQSLEDLRLDTEPVILALQKQHAGELVREAQAHFEENAWDLVQSKVRQVLELDATNTVARQLRELVRQRSHRVAVRPKIEALVKQGEECLSQRRFHDAIESFESALKLDTSDSGVRSRLLDAHSRYEQSKQAQDLINVAWRELKASNLTGAFERLAEAYRLDPDNSEGRRAMSAAQDQARRREIQREIEQEVKKANELAAIQCFDDALSLLGSLRGKHGAVPAIDEALHSISERKAQQEKARQREALIGGAKEQLKRGQFESAVMRLKSGLIDFAEDPELRQLLDYAEQQLENQRRLEALDRVRAEASRLIASGDFDAALHGIEIALKTNPGDASLVELTQAAVRGKAAQRREAAITSALRRAEEIAKNSGLAQALELLNETQGEYPEDSRVSSLSDRFREELARRERAEAVRRIVAQSVQLSREGDMDRAISLLQSSEAQYPESKELHEALAIARRTKAARDEQRAIAAALANAAAREQEQHWAAALNIIETGLLAYPNSEELNRRAAVLRDRIADEALKKAIAREARDIENLIASRRFEDAGLRIKAAHAAYPAEAVFDELLARSKAAVRAVREQAADRVRKSLRDGSLDQAGQALAEALEVLPGDSALSSLRGEIENERQCQACLAAAAAQLAAGNLDAAQKSLEEALRISPSHPAVNERLRDVAMRRKELERNRLIAEGRKNARELAQKGRFEEARRELAALLKQFPDANELWSHISEIESLQEQRQETERREAELTALFQLKDVGKPEQVLSGATQLLEVAPGETRARELANWAQGEIDRERLAREKAERDRAERAASEKAQREQADKAAREKAEQERAEQLARAEAQRLEAEAAAKEKVERERAARRARVKTDLERAEQLAREKAEREKESAAAAHPSSPPAAPVPVPSAPPAATPERKGPAGNRRKYIITAELAVILLLASAIWFRGRPRHTAELALEVATINATSRPGVDTPIHRTIRVEGGPMHVRVSSDAAWIKASPPEADTPVTLNIDLDPAPLRSGEHFGAIRIDGGEILRVVPVSLTVPPSAGKEPGIPPKPPAPVPAGGLTATPAAIAFEYQLSTSLPDPERVAVSSPAGAVPFNAVVAKGSEWLSVTPEAGTTPLRLAVQVHKNGLSAGQYEGLVTVREQRAGGVSQSIRASLRITPAAPPPVAPPTIKVQPPVTPPVQNPPPPAASEPPPVTPKNPGEPLRYGGAPRGTITWTGLLPPGGRLEFTADAVSAGSMRGHLPGVDVDLNINPPDSIKIETRPSAANHFGRLVLVNSGSAQVSSIEIRWKTR